MRVLGLDGQPVTVVKNAVVTRITRNELDGSFCRDRGRKLVVTLEAVDRICLRPAGTRQKLDAPLDEVYRWMVQRRAIRLQLERARERKIVKQRQREAHALDRAERKLRAKAKQEVICR